MPNLAGKGQRSGPGWRVEWDPNAFAEGFSEGFGEGSK